MDVENPIKLLNEELPADIRVLGVKKTTKMFDAKNSCSHRTYEYLTPTYAFAPIDEVSVSVESRLQGACSPSYACLGFCQHFVYRLEELCCSVSLEYITTSMLSYRDTAAQLLESANTKDITNTDYLLS